MAVILCVPLQTAGIHKGWWMWWKSCSIPAELLPSHHQRPCPKLFPCPCAHSWILASLGVLFWVIIWQQTPVLYPGGCYCCASSSVCWKRLMPELFALGKTPDKCDCSALSNPVVLGARLEPLIIRAALLAGSLCPPLSFGEDTKGWRVLCQSQAAEPWGALAWPVP